MDENRMPRLTENEINEVAVNYSRAKKTGNKNETDYYLAELYEIVIGNSIINRKLRWKFKELACDKDEANAEIHDYFWDRIKYYDSEKNDSITAFLCGFAGQYAGKKLKERGKQKSLDAHESDADNDDEMENDLIDTIAEKDRYDGDDRLFWICNQLVMLVTQFYEHNTKKSATKQRYNYFRIFTTERIADAVYNSQKTFYFNKTEAYECSDKDYVRFISYSDYEKLDDLLNLKFRKFSDVLEDYPDKEKLIELPCEGKIVAEYWYKSGLGEKRPTEANISDFRKKYEEYFKDMFSC